MKQPIGQLATLGTSAKHNLGTVPIVKLRDFFVTIRATFDGSATGDLRINALYSPDGKNYDTDPVDYFDLNVSAGNTRQTTASLAVPPHGTIMLQVENRDASYTATLITAWYSIQSWADVQPQYGGVGAGVDRARDIKFQDQEVLPIQNPAPMGKAVGG